MRFKTWNVIDGGDGFYPSDTISLQCPKCGVEADMPYHPDPDNPIIAANGLGIVFDRHPATTLFRVLPKSVKCRYCRSTYILGRDAEKEQLTPTTESKI